MLISSIVFLRYLALIVSGILVAACSATHDQPEDVRAGRPVDADDQPSSARHGTAHPWCAPGFAGPLLITPDSFGPVSVRTTRQQLRQVCPTTRDTVVFDAEANELAATALRFGDREAGWVVWTSVDRIERVQIVSPDAQTGRGIRVGSRVRDLRQATGRLTAGFDDAGVHLWSGDEPRVSYLLRLDILQLLTSPDDVAGHPEVVPDSAAVRAILLAPSH
jgi:hypothetical protein